jgi:hypothetical protein
MASIVEFKRVGLYARPSPSAQRGSAEIVIFPGVRYERASDDKAEKPRRRTRRRDRLDFDD